MAPVAKVLDETFSVERATMTTILAYTDDQRLLDLVHRDPLRSRAASLSIIPTTTGAAVAATLVYPKLKGRMNDLALRVPVPNVSIVNLTASLSRILRAAELQNQLFLAFLNQPHKLRT